MTSVEAKMYLAGLTGGFCSGKSTVSAIFKELGAYIIDADEISHRLTKPDTLVTRKIIDYFGPESLQPNGELDRKYLAAKIYSNDELRFALNAIIHPEVVKVIEKQIKEISAADPRAVIIADIPLLFETHTHFKWEKIIVVNVSRDEQFRRLSEKYVNFTLDDFEKRLRTQMPLEEKASRADFVIDNNGTIEDTRRQVARIYEQLKKFNIER